MNHFVIDGFNQAFRSHFAFSQLMTKMELPSGCVYGFLTSLRSLKKKHSDFHFTIAWDSGSKRKKEAFPEYKANRPRFVIDESIQDLKKFFSGIQVDQVFMAGEEADDVIASFIENHPEDKVYIYSNDKDLLQLVEDGHVIVIRPQSGKENKVYDEEAVRKEFGVCPQDLACFLSLRGDAVDNLPGIPRVPSKVLSSLTRKYKFPRNLYASIPGEALTDFQRKSILQSEQQVLLNYTLVELRRDLEYDKVEGRSDESILSEILRKYEIKSISAGAYIDLFQKEESFSMREGPRVESLSLF